MKYLQNLKQREQSLSQFMTQSVRLAQNTHGVDLMLVGHDNDYKIKKIIGTCIMEEV